MFSFLYLKYYVGTNSALHKILGVLEHLGNAKKISKFVDKEKDRVNEYIWYSYILRTGYLIILRLYNETSLASNKEKSFTRKI